MLGTGLALIPPSFMALSLGGATQYSLEDTAGQHMQTCKLHQPPSGVQLGEALKSFLKKRKRSSGQPVAALGCLPELSEVAEQTEVPGAFRCSPSIEKQRSDMLPMCLAVPAFFGCMLP